MNTLQNKLLESLVFSSSTDSEADPSRRTRPTSGRRVQSLLFLPLLLICASLFVTGCNSGDAPSVGGQLEIWLHDAPADFEEVQIYVERVEIGKRGGGWTVLGEPGQHFDLLRLTNGSYEILGKGQIEEGDYHQLRLILSADDNYIMESGERRTLFVPSGAQSGLKLNIDANISDDSHYVLLLDFDVERSIVQPGSGGNPADYILKPVIRTTWLEEAGHISGVITPPESRAAVFAISGQDTLSTTYADVETGEFTLFGLREGDYQVAVNSREVGFADIVMDGISVTPGETQDLGVIQVSPSAD